MRKFWPFTFAQVKEDGREIEVAGTCSAECFPHVDHVDQRATLRFSPARWLAAATVRRVAAMRMRSMDYNNNEWIGKRECVILFRNIM